MGSRTISHLLQALATQLDKCKGLATYLRKSIDLCLQERMLALNGDPNLGKESVLKMIRVTKINNPSITRGVSCKPLN